MRYAFTASALLAAMSTVAADCTEEAGNWYCNPVQASTWTNFGTPGQYNKITSMVNGACGSTPQTYDGGMSPMDGEVSWHFRGPMHLKQFAFYTPGSSASKRDFKPTPHQRRHGHDQYHRGKQESRKIKAEQNNEKKRGIGDVVTATINGQVVSWINTYGGPSTSSSIPLPASSTQPPPEPSPQQPPIPPSGSSPVNAGAGNWGRQAYYNAEQGHAEGMVFLNHHGGINSGVFDYKWGSSLSYATADGTTGSASPVVLADALIQDDNEVVVMTNNPCLGNDCGTYRPGAVAYHGFAGASKLFLLEYAMPLSGKQGFLADMPAAWILNAAIPRTLQYGEQDCSCWLSGCGEWDIFEVLDSGNTKSKSTWHGLKSIGDSNWFPRPIEGTQKAAVVFDGTTSTGHIIFLPNTTTFDTVLADSLIAGLLNSVPLSTPLNSKVALPP